MIFQTQPILWGVQSWPQPPFSAQAAERGCKESPTLPQKPRGARPLCAELVENRYWPVCPDFVIELRSQSDRHSVLREKMGEWLANGAQLAWLIDPEVRTVEIYRPGFEAETIGGVPSVAGLGPVEGFVLDLAPVWDPLHD